MLHRVKSAVLIALAALVMLAGAGVSMAGAVINGNRTVTGTLDLSTAHASLPCPVGTSTPATCTVGECFFDSAVAAGANLYLCTATNTWTQVGAETDPVVKAINGIVKSNGTTISAASAGLDYVTPAGNVATATALAANGSNCSTWTLAAGTDASGSAEGCAAPPNSPLSTKRQGRVVQQGNGGSFSGVGVNAPNTSWSSSCGSVAADTAGAMNRYKYPTGATSGNACGLENASAVTANTWAPTLQVVLDTDTSIADARIWVALTAVDLSGVAPTIAQAVRAGKKAVGLAYDSAVDTHWLCCASTGVAVSGTMSCTSTGVTVATSTTYNLTVDYTQMNTSVTCTVNGTAVTQTSDLPTSAYAAWLMEASITTLTNAAKTFYIGRLGLAQN